MSKTSYTESYMRGDLIILNFIGNSAATIALLIVGGVLLILMAVQEYYTSRSAIIPPRLFRVRWIPLSILRILIVEFNRPVQLLSL